MKNTLKKIKDKILIITILILIISLVPLILNYVISRKALFDVAGDEGDWVNFWGSYIGCIVAVLGIYLTLRNDRKNRLAENRMSVIPYIMLNDVLPTNRGIPNIIFDIKEKSYIKDCSNPYKKDYYSGYFSFSNEGLGIALDVTFQYNNKMAISTIANLSLKKGFNAPIYNIGISKDTYTTKCSYLVLSYFNTLGDKYTQKIYFTIDNKQMELQQHSLYINKSNYPELV